MTKRLLFLNGLAILMIPIHHATAYGLQAMFGWSVPDDVGTYLANDPASITAFYSIVMLRQLLTFAVPAFLFISGYFVAFMARGEESKVTFKQVLPRIRILIPPFLIWTAVRFLLLRRIPNGIDEILNPYHFIPLLIQFYLLAPFLVPLAKKHPKLLLATAAILQLGLQAVHYVNDLGLDIQAFQFIDSLIPRWIFLGQQPFWFPFGLVIGLHARHFGRILVQNRWKFLAGMLLFVLLTMAEYLWVDRLNSNVQIGQNFSVFTKNFYILFVLLAALSFDVAPGTPSKIINHISARSLGIYMANIPVIYIISVFIYRVIPGVLEIQLIYQPLLVIVGMAIPLLLMWVVRQTQLLRPSYRYLFG